jgi:hypothetical protein
VLVQRTETLGVGLSLEALARMGRSRVLGREAQRALGFEERGVLVAAVVGIGGQVGNLFDRQQDCQTN